MRGVAELARCAPTDCAKLPGPHALLAGSECQVARSDDNVQDPRIPRDTKGQVNDQHGALKLFMFFATA
eukprot:11221060-Lingulodinium_polyedra.AAC.1